jgi:hypothetical protein
MYKILKVLIDKKWILIDKKKNSLNKKVLQQNKNKNKEPEF